MQHTYHVADMGITSSYSLFGAIQEPRSKFSPRRFVLSLEPKGHERKEGQRQLHEYGEKIFRVVDLAHFHHLLRYLRVIAVVIKVILVVIFDIIVRHGAAFSFSPQAAISLSTLGCKCCCLSSDRC